MCVICEIITRRVGIGVDSFFSLCPLSIHCKQRNSLGCCSLSLFHLHPLPASMLKRVYYLSALRPLIVKYPSSESKLHSTYTTINLEKTLKRSNSHFLLYSSHWPSPDSVVGGGIGRCINFDKFIHST